MKSPKLFFLFSLLALAVSLSPVSAFAADGGDTGASTAGSSLEKQADGTITSDYFYNQLNARAKAIYDKLLEKFTSDGTEKYKGTDFIDLIGLKYGENGEKIDKNAVEAYKEGNKSLFDDFCAAKDALDLDHSELWWIDSGYLSFQVTQNTSKDSEANGGYHVLVGPGRGKTYLLAGQEISDKTDVQQMDKDVDKTINDIVNKAKTELANNENKNYSTSDKTAFLVSNIHDQITKGIHYRYEVQCRNQENAKYIRTIYGIQTHEGVCEAYARTLQVALTRAGVQCVLIHGVQAKGTPEDHMWNAVNIPDDNDPSKERWYVVDATWDDPLVANYDGSQDTTFNNGDDGHETNIYLMVGQSTVGEYWRPSGFVSTGNFEFKYPTISDSSYDGSTVYNDSDGFEVKYSAGATMEGVPAGVFVVKYQGMNAAKAREKGLYFMVKMYDYHADGTTDVMNEWYYADATIAAMGSSNQYFGDNDDALRIYSPGCEYVEIAVTTRKPYGLETWNNHGGSGNALSENPMVGYFQGDESEIVAQTGMLYNVNSDYEAPPYVKTQTPAPNGNVTAGVQYRFKVTYDDALYHIKPDSLENVRSLALANTDEANYEEIKDKTVQVRYTTDQENLHAGDGSAMATEVAGELPFDLDRDGVVDMDSDYVDFKWIYESEDPNKCSNKEHHEGGTCDVNKGCPIIGVEFNFKASDLWIDDLTKYTFTIEGVVGSRSSKYPNDFAAIARITGRCATCYRSEGFDWNVWGQPTLLDAPEDLNLQAVAETDDVNQDTLKKLNEEIHTDDINGRLMLVVEDKSEGVGSRAGYEEINDALSEKGEEPDGKVIGSSIFEINFNRICPAIKLKPNEGQAIRVQVGYPAGIDYKSLGEGKVELKAYHFTRCANNETDQCEEYKEELKKAGGTKTGEADVKANHAWGSHIVSVEEIDLVPTPYGLVIMCNSFSPFEIVAIDKSDSAEAAQTTPEKDTCDVVVVSNEHGKVKFSDDGKTVSAVGADGNRKVNKGGSLDFTVEPDSGYVVDTVAFGGEVIDNNKDAENAYTLSNVTKNDVLNVTFVPETVQEQKIASYGNTVVAKACEHSETETTARIEPECLTSGSTEKTVCTKCGAVLKAAAVLPPKGHTPDKELTAAKPATCTEDGHTATIMCTTCKKPISKESTIQALGHLFKTYTPTEVKSCKGVKMHAICERGCGATDESMWDASSMSIEEIESLHTYGADGLCTVCGTQKPDDSKSPSNPQITPPVSNKPSTNNPGTPDAPNAGNVGWSESDTPSEGDVGKPEALIEAISSADPGATIHVTLPEEGEEITFEATAPIPENVKVEGIILGFPKSSQAGSVSTTYDPKTKAFTLEAEPKEGNDFVSWDFEGEVISTSNPWVTTIAKPEPKLSHTLALENTDSDIQASDAGAYVATFEETENTLEAKTVTVFRLYNPYLSGAHLLTTDENEVMTLSDLGWQSEGPIFEVYAKDAEGKTPVYRLYNPHNGDHHFTTSETEASYLDNIGWDREGIGWCSGGDIEVHRLYNPYQTDNAGLGNHLWTASQNEVNTIVPLGWSYENIAWKALKSY